MAINHCRTFFWSGRRESRVRIANAQPLGASAFGRIPKNSPLDCFSAEFHRIGSIPSLRLQPNKRKTTMAINHCRTFFWSGRRESNPRHKLGKLIPYPIFRDLNYPSDLAVLKTNTVILANVLDEILEKRLVFQPTNNSTLKHESRQNGDFRHVISGAGDENRTRVRCLGSIGNNHYTTPALANHYNSAAVHPTGQFNETPRVSA